MGLGLVVFFLNLKGPELHQNYIRNKVGKEVVLIKVGPYSGGTGFYLNTPSGKSIIVTNAHICKNFKRVRVYKNNQNYTYSTNTILKKIKEHDLCFIRSKSKHGLDFAGSINVGQKVSLVGHPNLNPLTTNKGEVLGRGNADVHFGFNLPKHKCPGDYTSLLMDNNVPMIQKGILLSKKIFSICQKRYDSIMLSIYSNKGNSGSPVVNFWGNVVGVLFANNIQRRNAYIVPLDVLYKEVSKL